MHYFSLLPKENMLQTVAADNGLSPEEIRMYKSVCTLLKAWALFWLGTTSQQVLCATLKHPQLVYQLVLSNYLWQHTTQVKYLESLRNGLVVGLWQC